MGKDWLCFPVFFPAMQEIIESRRCVVLDVHASRGRELAALFLPGEEYGQPNTVEPGTTIVK